MSLKRAFFTLIGAGISAQIILFAGMLVLARIYSPSDFGEYGFYAGIASLTAVIAGLRYDYLAFAANNKPQQLLHFYRAALTFCILTAGTTFIVANLLASNFKEYKHFSIHATLFVLSSALYLIGTQLLLAKKEYSKYATLRLYQAVAQIAIAGALYTLDSPNGLIVAFAGSQLAIGLYILKHSNAISASVTPKATRKIIKTHFSAALINTATTALQYSTPFAPTIAGAIFYKPSDVGAYFLITQLIAAPCAIFRRSATNLLNSEFNNAILLKKKIIQHKIFIFRTFALGLSVAIPCFVAIHTFQIELVSSLIGPQWLTHAEILTPVLIYYLFDSILQPSTTLLPLWGRQADALFIEALRFLSVFGALAYLTLETESSFITIIETHVTIMIAWYLIGLLRVAFITMSNSSNE